jgi:hypothetical protein
MNHELDRVRILNRLPIVIRRLPISMLVLLAALPLAAQDWSAGFHGNDHSGYGWLTHYYRLPTGPGEQLVFSGTVSYLYYDAVIGGSRVRVTSPGVGAAAMYRWSRPNLSLGVGPGWEVRWTDRGADRVTESGALLLGDMSYRRCALFRSQRLVCGERQRHLRHHAAVARRPGRFVAGEPGRDDPRDRRDRRDSLRPDMDVRPRRPVTDHLPRRLARRAALFQRRHRPELLA